jgi:Predicted Zn-dependent peptidases
MTRILARISAVGAALIVSTATASAQELDRSQRPAAMPAPTFKFPKMETHTLANGLRLIVVEDHALPLVATRIVLAVDSTADPAGKEGLYAVTVGALREGTTSTTPDQLAEAFADVGATVSPTGFTTTTRGILARSRARRRHVDAPVARPIRHRPPKGDPSRHRATHRANADHASSALVLCRVVWSERSVCSVARSDGGERRRDHAGRCPKFL